MVWDQALYILAYDLYIAPSAKLTIEPGVTVIGVNTFTNTDAKRIAIAGSIEINGTEELPVVFMAMHPDLQKAPRLWIRDNDIENSITNIEHTYFLCSDDSEWPAIEIEVQMGPRFKQININDVHISNFKSAIKDARTYYRV